MNVHILQASSHIHPVIAELFINLHHLNSKISILVLSQFGFFAVLFL